MQTLVQNIEHLENEVYRPIEETINLYKTHRTIPWQYVMNNLLRDKFVEVAPGIHDMIISPPESETTVILVKFTSEANEVVMDFHNHDFTEHMLVTRGWAVVQILGEKPIPMMMGRSYSVPAGTFHKVWAKQGSEMIITI